MKHAFKYILLLFCAVGILLAQDTTPVISGNVTTTQNNTYSTGTTQGFAIATASNLTVTSLTTSSNLVTVARTTTNDTVLGTSTINLGNISVGTVSNLTSTNLTVVTSATIPSASISTNTANIGRSINSLAMNQIFTNGNQRTFVSASFALVAAVGQPGKVILMTLDSGTPNAIGIASADAGVIFNATEQLVGWVNPNQIFVYSNFSGAGASATMLTNIVWRF